MSVLARRRLRARVRSLAPHAGDNGVAERLGALLVRIPPLRMHDPRALGAQAIGSAFAALLLASSTHGLRALAAIPVGVLGGARGGLAWFERDELRAQRDARATLPQTLDRLTTCVLAGMSVERALRTVAPDTSGALGVALAEGLRALDLGMTRSRAYDVIAQRAGIDEVRAFMAALVRAERFGTSVSETLVAQAREARSRARAAAEQEARTAPVKLIFPLVFCFLPAFVLLTIAPIAISAVRTLTGI